MNQMVEQAGLMGRSGLMDGYGPLPDRFDEFFNASVGMGAAWGQLKETLDGLGRVGLLQREDQLKNLIKDYGVTYNVYGGAAGRDPHAWSMDLVPFMISREEHLHLEEGLSQRAFLLNEILADVYGPQRLMERGRLPSDLVLGNPRFFPACHRLLPPKHKHLWIYSADLVRSIDGGWWVIGDHLDAASGLGYALENREMMHRVLPEPLRRSQVNRLMPFLTDLREALESLAGAESKDPHLVLLTPGPGNETYYEHSFLARGLGCSLVEGEDLSVRNGRVYLKTTSGMQRVHVMLRRLDGEWCDPLELRNDSLLGVAGLLHSIRLGQVGVANGVGCGLLESKPFSAFLPSVCQEFLGEELKIPSIRTWWCGQDAELKFVLDHLESLQLYRLTMGNDQEVGAEEFRTEEGRQAIRQKITHQPHLWCAQEPIKKATTPSWVGGEIKPRPYLFRVFLVRHKGQFRMMPGGLVRVAAGEGSDNVSMQRGGVSKDAWVIGPCEKKEGDSDGLVRWNTVAPRLLRSAQSLPSRVADNLFWLGRYFERTEGQARLIRVLTGSLMEDVWGNSGEAIYQLFTALGSADELLDLRLKGNRLGMKINIARADSILRWWVRDPSNHMGLVSNLRNTVRTAGKVKERLSLDTWQFLSKLEQYSSSFPMHSGSMLENQAVRKLDALISQLSGISGMAAENMTRGHAWTFQDIGRRIERALNHCNLLYSTLCRITAGEEALLRMVLLCGDSILTYRRRYYTTFHSVPVMDLLICDPDNPRSLAYQARRIKERVEGLPHLDNVVGGGSLAGVADRILGHIALFDPAEVSGRVKRGKRYQLRNFLDEVANHLLRMSDLLGTQYFAVIPNSVEDGPMKTLMSPRQTDL